MLLNDITKDDIPKYAHLFQINNPHRLPTVNASYQKTIRRCIKQKNPNKLYNALRAYQSCLWEQYNIQLAKHDYPNVKDQDKFNILDVTGICGKIMKGQGTIEDRILLSITVKQYINKHNGFYERLPCFTEGIMNYRVSPDAPNTQFYWKILNIDPNNESIKIRLISIAPNNNQNNLYIYDAIITIQPTTLKYTCESLSKYQDIHHICSKKELQWNNIDLEVWNAHLQNYINIINDGLTWKQKQLDEMIMIDIERFFTFNLIANAIMAKKAKNNSTNHTNVQPHPTPTKIIQTPAKQQKRTVHNFDNMIRVSTDDNWKPSASPKTIHYVAPSWNVRGHVRHYKNGKTVYIKPHTKHRQNMKSTTDAPKQTIHINA